MNQLLAKNLCTQEDTSPLCRALGALTQPQTCSILQQPSAFPTKGGWPRALKCAGRHGRGTLQLGSDPRGGTGSSSPYSPPPRLQNSLPFAEAASFGDFFFFSFSIYFFFPLLLLITKAIFKI